MSKHVLGIALFALAVLMVGTVSAQGLLNRRPGLGARPNRLGGARGAQQQQQAPGGEAAKTAEDILKEIPKGTNGVPTRLAFDQAPIDVLLYAYADVAGKILLPSPGLPKTQITLKTFEDRELTKEEYLEAIEVTLTMHGVVIEPFDKIFLRAFDRKSVRTQGIQTSLHMPTNAIPEKGKVISQLIRLQHITAEEAQKAIEGFKAPEGLFQVFERNNTILVTDTQENINRMLEVIRELDVANPVLEDVFVRQIQYAVATDIKTALETIVTESQKENASQAQSGPKMSGSPGFSSRPSPQPNRLLNLNNRLGGNKAEPSAPTPNATMMAQVSDADRGMIRGKVLILADERSNKLIVITAKTNMDFFDKVIETLDVETTPEVSVEVIRLKYADAEEVASMLNDLIGNNSSSSQSKNNQNANTAKGGTANRNLTQTRTRTGTAGRSTSTTANPTFSKASSSLGELNKDNIKILADKRINGIIIMARKADMKAVKEVVEDMDVKLSQVLIETVIVQVELGDGLNTGIDWVKQNNGDLGRGNYGLGGGGGSGSGLLTQLVQGGIAAATNNSGYGASPIGGGINYLVKSDKLNISAVVQASKSDSRTKVLASPILMTVDNKEATIEATDMIYLFSGYQYSGSSMYGSQVRNYEKRDIGLTVKVTPRINPNGTVVLTVEQTFETQGADQNVPNETGGTDPYATVTTRKIASDVSVENRQTVVMGGLTKKTNTESESGIPILKDIPWVGKWLFGRVEQKEARSELLVFMTPYVLDDADAAQAEAIRRKKTLSDARPWEDNGWSESAVADPIPRKEMLRRLNDEWKRQDEERKNQKAIEEAKAKRARKLAEMDAEERKAWAEKHQEEILEEQKRFEEEQVDLRELIDDIREKNKPVEAAPASEPGNESPAEKK